MAFFYFFAFMVAIFKILNNFVVPTLSNFELVIPDLKETNKNYIIVLQTILISTFI